MLSNERVVLWVLFDQSALRYDLRAQTREEEEHERQQDHGVDHRVERRHEAADERPEGLELDEEPERAREPREPQHADDHEGPQALHSFLADQGLYYPVGDHTLRHQDEVKADPVAAEAGAAHGEEAQRQLEHVDGQENVLEDDEGRKVEPLQLVLGLQADRDGVREDDEAEDHVEALLPDELPRLEPAPEEGPDIRHILNVLFPEIVLGHLARDAQSSLQEAHLVLLLLEPLGLAE
mmetsp:Transcript_16485/g.48293  ORF Transcript_16485/g.48293 Transcript_16485/m.48293 type:complete len:237 (-) Transcript_16485:858-1568(-)